MPNCDFKMTPLVLLFALVVGKTAAEGVVDLKCSDNATCLDNLTKEFVRSLRQQKTVRLFDYLTIEPLGRTRAARSSQGPVARFLENHAFSFDWNDLSFRLAKPQNRNDAVELEIFEGRTAKGELKFVLCIAFEPLICLNGMVPTK